TPRTRIVMRIAPVAPSVSCSTLPPSKLKPIAGRRRSFTDTRRAPWSPTSSCTGQRSVSGGCGSFLSRTSIAATRTAAAPARSSPPRPVFGPAQPPFAPRRSRLAAERALPVRAVVPDGGPGQPGPAQAVPDVRRNSALLAGRAADGHHLERDGLRAPEVGLVNRHVASLHRLGDQQPTYEAQPISSGAAVSGPQGSGGGPGVAGAAAPRNREARMGNASVSWQPPVCARVVG